MKLLNEGILALDYGIVDVGVAFARGAFVTTLPVLSNDGELIGKVLNMCGQEGITKILIGLPESPQREVVESFAAELRSQFSGSVIFWDEVLTSVQARDLLRENESKKKKEDSASAALFLQEYLAASCIP